MLRILKGFFYQFLCGSLAAALLFCTCQINAETPDETYQKALKEGGTLHLYGTLTPTTAVAVLPVFEKRFPGIKVENTGASADKIVARAISEARGGRIIGDVFHMNLENVMQVREQGMVLEKVPPEADLYSNNLKGSYWVGTRINTIVAAWNTNLLKKQEEPKQFEDFADPKWKGKLLAEPRDAELLVAFANHKYDNLDKAVSLLKKNRRKRCGISSGPSGVGGIPGRRTRFCLHHLLHASSIAQDEERRADRLHVLRGNRHGQCHRGIQKCASSELGVAFLSLGFDR